MTANPKEKQNKKNVKIIYPQGKSKQNKLVARSPDVVIPIAFPDYKIATPIGKLPELGHAGVLFFNGSNGTTKYYEYGRYDKENLGIVRKVIIPDVIMGKDGHPTKDSLTKTLKVISEKAGHNTRIKAVYIEAEKEYDKMLTHVENRRKLNGDKNRKSYSLFSNNCMTFAKETVEAAGVKTPWMLDPRPNSYINELRSQFPDLDYDPKNNKLEIKEVYENAE